MRSLCVAFLLLLPAAALGQATNGNTITTNTIMATPGNNTLVQSRPPRPTISAPASVGRPHICPVQKFYPPQAMVEHAEGITKLNFTIMADGTVANLSVAESSGDDRLDQASLICARDWVYKPALQNNVPVAVPWKTMVQWLAGPRTLQPSGAFIIPVATGPAHVCHPVAKTNDPLPGVALTFNVEPDGRVTNVTAQTPSGDADFDASAIACVSSWRFRPPLIDGKPGEIVWRTQIP
jgi:TonB family protein